MSGGGGGGRGGGGLERIIMAFWYREGRAGWDRKEGWGGVGSRGGGGGVGELGWDRGGGLLGATRCFELSSAGGASERGRERWSAPCRVRVGR